MDHPPLLSHIRARSFTGGADGGCRAVCACSSYAPPGLAPRITLTVTASEDLPGSYGQVGAYQKLSGTIAGEVDPRDRHNAIIQDLALAPVNARGMVEYKTEFVLLKPRDMTKANGVLRYDVPNRGNILTMPTTDLRR